jgi:hypothetical protein
MGTTSLVSSMPITSVGGVHALATSGIGMRYFSPSRAHYLWRVVDQDENVLDILVQRRRDKQAAKKFFRKLLKGLRYVPWVISLIIMNHHYWFIDYEELKKRYGSRAEGVNQICLRR